MAHSKHLSRLPWSLSLSAPSPPYLPCFAQPTNSARPGDPPAAMSSLQFANAKSSPSAASHLSTCFYLLPPLSDLDKTVHHRPTTHTKPTMAFDILAAAEMM